MDTTQLQVASDAARQAARDNPCAETREAAKLAFAALEAATPQRKGNGAKLCRVGQRNKAERQQWKR